MNINVCIYCECASFFANVFTFTTAHTFALSCTKEPPKTASKSPPHSELGNIANYKCNLAN